MIAWIEFAFGVVFFAVMLVCLWTDADEWFHHAQHELVLDELWGSDDDLAESA